MKKSLIVLFTLILAIPSYSQFFNTPEELTYYTSEWSGERFQDGRPKVPEAILERMKKVSIEEAWGVLRGEGFHNQFAGDWKMIHFLDDDHVELYNLAEDIGEHNDLSAAQTARVEELMQLLENWRRDVNADMPGQNPDFDVLRRDEWGRHPSRQ